jgi:hypothetical protein
MWNRCLSPATALKFYRGKRWAGSTRPFVALASASLATWTAEVLTGAPSLSSFSHHHFLQSAIPPEVRPPQDPLELSFVSQGAEETHQPHSIGTLLKRLPLLPLTSNQRTRMGLGPSVLDFLPLIIRHLLGQASEGWLTTLNPTL